MVMCKFDSNLIDVELTKDRSTEALCKAKQALWKWLVAIKVVQPKLHVYDSEALSKEHYKLQLVLADTHRQNMKEQAIQTFKNPFIAVPIFPMHLWDRIVLHDILTLMYQ